MAALLVPTASQCLRLAGPLLALFGVIWFWRYGDEVLARLFPHWEWERKLGWLNVKANRHVERILRMFTHLLHVTLLAALVGILGFSWLLGQPQDTDTYLGIFSRGFQWINLMACYMIWVYYFLVILGPRMRDEFELEELTRYRVEHPDTERERVKERMKISVWDSTRPRRF
jgi:hypothetical protein